ncbi:hypothetical protein GCM10009087_41280 [Sphingomonas oligophenolica]|uniref:Class I SAM-dependent methyltransferase n=1 Tax=Sphingomonas oligophenolica TaxID=301154 RepID=A0ABU9YCR1_9SPHN
MVDKCIVCGSDTSVAHSFKGSFIRSALTKYFRETPGPGVPIPDVEILKCTQCSLEFCKGMQPGDNIFYDWITKQAGYYPEFRWEWASVLKIFAEAAEDREIQILDVGCGGGTFLKLAREIPNVKVVGVDMTSQSVEDCKAAGLDVVCGDIEEFHRQRPEDRFDFVVSFHCIEHVSDPVSLTREMASLLADNGALLVSAPLSPMSFETIWFDPLNFPPHHLSRWSVAALEKLGQQVNLTAEINSNPAGSNRSRASRALALSKIGPSATRPQTWACSILNPMEFIKEFGRQKARPQLNGVSLGNTFLAVFRVAA